METAENNELLTRVGPGTPMGNLMRRYWQAIGAVSEMDGKWTRKVRLLGEDLVLFRDRQGRVGLVAEHCTHRGASLLYGIPTDNGIRCPYHGWEFSAEGKCVNQPNEIDNAHFRDKVGTQGYPVAELGGLHFAYLGPLPAPELPRFDGFVHPGTIRQLGKVVLPINWLQCMENSLDPIHTEWLHGHHYEFQQEGVKVAISTKHEKIDFKEFEFGMTKHRLLAGHSEDGDDWRIGHPIVFPNMLAVGNGDEKSRYFSFQIRVPVDDENTLHLWYNAYVPPPGAKVPPLPHLLDTVHVYNVPYKDEATGEFIVDNIDGQDMMAWITQGRIADRTSENLGATDKGVMMYRRMLKRELKKVQEGQDPMGVIRDAARNRRIDLPNERKKHHNSDGFASFALRTHAKYSPIIHEVVHMFEDFERATAKAVEA